MVTFTEAKRRPRMPLPHLIHPIVEVEDQTFTRGEVVEMFGNSFPRSHITKIRDVLADIPKYDPLNRVHIWRIYVFECWRQVQMIKNGTKSAWKSRFTADFNALGAEKFLETYVDAIKGSQKDCNDMIDKFLAKKFTNKLN